MQYSMVRCENHIVNKDKRWHIQDGLTKINLVTEVLVLDIILLEMKPQMTP